MLPKLQIRPKRGKMNSPRINRRTLLLSVSSASLFGCSITEPIGRDDRKPAEGGIGGTGIVGLLSEFGSLIINGEKVITDSGTRYSDALGSISPNALSIGNSLTIEARRENDGLSAKRVHLTHPLIGKIEKSSSDGATLSINGIIVRVEPQARRTALRGDTVAVSGTWRGTEVIASHMAIRATDTPSVIAGSVRPSDEAGSITIGATTIRLPEFAPRLAFGSFATATGTMHASVFNASRVTPNRFVGAAGALKELLVEGYLDPIGKAPGFEISGLGHSFAPTTQLDAFAGSRVVFGGAYNGTFEAAWGIPLPVSFRQRQRLMRVLMTDPDRIERIETR